jgi:uncharacterized membrane protein YedE/YeeE
MKLDLASAVVGGVIIGISSTGFLLASGKLSGISGFVENTLSPAVPLDDKLWAIAYLVGLILAGITASAVDRPRLGVTTEVRWSLLLGALLVGFGARMGCGCTSGHGISGLPRFSLRALVAVCTFMSVATLAAPCGRLLEDVGIFPIVGDSLDLPSWDAAYTVVLVPFMAYAVVSVLLKLYYNWVYPIPVPDSVTSEQTSAWIHETKLQHAGIALIAGFVFGLGLAVSGMCSPQRVKRFLDFSGPDGWDPSLAGVMGGGVLFNMISFHLMHKHNVEVLVVVKKDPNDTINLNNVIKMWKHPANLHLPPSFVIGSVCFGLGWGLCGVCPGPGLVNLGASSRVSAAFLPPLLLGMALHEVYKSIPEWNREDTPPPEAQRAVDDPATPLIRNNHII